MGKRGKVAMWIAGVLTLLALATGFWSGWSLLGLMNRVDGVLANDDAVLIARNTPYGGGIRKAVNIWGPKGGAKQAMPRTVIVFFYGGSWKSGDRDLYDFAGRALAERGYIVVVADYRLVPEVRFPAFVEDGAAAIAWTHANIARYGGNPDRIFTTGHSAGAHIAAMVTLDPQWLAKAGAPVDTIKGFIGLAGPYDFFPFTTDAARAAFSHLPDPAISQPIHYARADAPPMLFLTGSADTTVKPRNSRVLSEAITKLGGRAQMRVYDGIDHSGIIMALAKPFRGKAPVIANIDEFIQTVPNAAKGR